jgi:hypothetical protein
MVPPGLQHHTKPRPPPLITPCGVNPKNPDLTSRAHPESLQDLDGGRLASPVRPEQGQHLATARAELDALQHIHRPVAHPETANVDHRTLARLLDLRAQHPQLVHHSTPPFDLLDTMICSNYTIPCWPCKTCVPAGRLVGWLCLQGTLVGLDLYLTLRRVQRRRR